MHYFWKHQSLSVCEIIKKIIKRIYRHSPFLVKAVFSLIFFVKQSGFLCVANCSLEKGCKNIFLAKYLLKAWCTDPFSSCKSFAPSLNAIKKIKSQNVFTLLFNTPRKKNLKASCYGWKNVMMASFLNVILLHRENRECRDEWVNLSVVPKFHL